jgi:hypothetical protein
MACLLFSVKSEISANMTRVKPEHLAMTFPKKIVRCVSFLQLLIASWIFLSQVLKSK